MEGMVHETAIVDDGARIGSSTRIWHWVHVCTGARIGENCSLGQNVFIGNNVTIGNNVKIQNNVSVYDGVILEDDVFCGPSMVFTNVYNPRSAVSRKDEFRPTYVQQGATLGANCTIICGITIGVSALLLLVPLAITSTNAMRRRLGRRWQKLHRLIYLIAGLGVWHFYWQVKEDILEPSIYIFILVVLLGYRVLARRFAQRASRTALPRREHERIAHPR